MIRVSCFILAALISSVIRTCDAIPIENEDSDQNLYRIEVCDEYTELDKKYVDQYDTVAILNLDCKEDKHRTVLLPTLTSIKQIGKTIVFENIQTNSAISVLGENKNEIFEVQSGERIYLTFENGWDLVSEEEANEIVKEEDRVWALYNSTKHEPRYFSKDSVVDGDGFSRFLAHYVEVAPDHKLNTYYFPPLNAQGEGSIVKFSNMSPDVVYIELIKKRRIRVNAGHTLYIKYFNGWKGVH